MDFGSVILWFFTIILLLVLVFVFVKFIRGIRGRRHALVDRYGYLPSHTELYFEKHFPTLISEWDLITKSKLEQWKKGIQGKLKSVGSGIDEIIDYRKNLDSRMDKLEKEIGTLERK